MHAFSINVLTKSLLSSPPGVDAVAEMRRSLPAVFEATAGVTCCPC